MQTATNYYPCVHYVPRPYQIEALTQLDLGCVMNIWVWARRGGKDLTGFAYAIKKMVEQPMNVVMVWPTKKQGYDNFWTTIENDGFKTLEHIPRELIANQTNSPTDMRITLKNGSTLVLLGATDPDALRGANGKLYIFSEFVDIPGEALDVIRPIVAVNGGQIIIQSTPKIDGISGGTFKILFDRAKTTAKQYASIVTAREYLSDEVLEDLRQEAIAKYGNDFFWRQEYLCDWGQASSTTYYGAIMAALEARGQITTAPYDPAHPAFTAWDLGMSDMMAITFFQNIKAQPRIIDYYETHNTAYAPIVKYVQAKPYNVMWNFLPHDATVRDSDAIERIEKVRQEGLINSSLLKREAKDIGINRAVGKLHRTLFNEATTTDLRRKLILYKKKFNPKTGDYMGPEHNTTSHAADTIRYMFKALEDEFDEKTGEFMYSPDSAQDTYETDEILLPSSYRSPGW